MIRILFSIVAVVAAVLGLVLPMPGLLLAAAFALVITFALMLRRRQRTQRPHRDAVPRASERETNADSEMASLGILEIRPRAREGSRDVPQSADDRPDGRHDRPDGSRHLPDAARNYSDGARDLQARPEAGARADGPSVNDRWSNARTGQDVKSTDDDPAGAPDAPGPYVRRSASPSGPAPGREPEEPYGDGAMQGPPASQATGGPADQPENMDFNAWLARRRQSQEAGSAEGPAESAEGPADSGDLADFEDAQAARPVPGGDDELSDPPDTVPPSRTKQRDPVQSTITVKERTQAVRASIDETASEHYREMLLPYLQAFRAVVDAHTVCLLRQPVDALHFHIEGIVSVNAYARSGGNFSSRIPLLQTRESHAAVEIRRVARDDFPPSGLGYYREQIAVKALAVAAVPYPSSPDRFVLLADSMKEDGLDSERSRSMVSHFARLLGAVMENASGVEVAEAYDYVRPRREIIADEMAAARKGRRPLALALVYLNLAESVADRGEREVKVAERTLAAHLRRTARQARVERFGELTFGVFFAATGPEVERWAMRVQHELADVDGPLEGGVSIGIALLQDRHTDADTFRRDATDALREAYESGTCTIVEF